MLADEDILRTDVFNYEFAQCRIELYNLVNKHMNWPIPDYIKN